MKKVFRVTLLVVGLVLIGLAGFVAFAALRGVPRYDPPVVQDFKVEATPARLARGEKIAQMMCIQCHMGANNRLTGRQMDDLPAFLGTVYTVNITQDNEHGIGKYTNGELMYFLRTGIRRDGSFAPIMPKFALMADEDIKSIIAWLRSDSPVLQPSAEEAPASEYSLVAKLLTNSVMKPLPYSPKLIAIPDSTNEVAFGRYVADAVVACYACHSADFTKQDPLHPELSAGYYGGGNAMMTPDKKPILTANLTFDAGTGLGGKYTKNQFIQAVKACIGPDGRMLRAPMPPHHKLTDYEAGAIYEYLKTVPKIQNDIPAKEAELASR
jgi:mono/diheme cytochrome c family protein